MEDDTEQQARFALCGAQRRSRALNFHRMLKIDTHTHIMPKVLPDWSRKLGYGAFIQLEHHKVGSARMMQGDRFFREVQANCWDAQIRIEEYAKCGGQVQVVCTIPVLFALWTSQQFWQGGRAPHSPTRPSPPAHLERDGA